MSVFSLRFKELREKRCLSQRAIALELSLSPSTIGMWESQKREPDFKTVVNLADYFQVTTDYLLGRTDDPTEKSPSVAEATPRDSVSMEESTQLLVALGLIKEGQQLSDEDLAFLSHIMGMLDAWFSSKGE